MKQIAPATLQNIMTSIANDEGCWSTSFSFSPRTLTKIKGSAIKSKSLPFTTLSGSKIDAALNCTTTIFSNYLHCSDFGFYFAASSTSDLIVSLNFSTPSSNAAATGSTGVLRMRVLNFLRLVSATGSSILLPTTSRGFSSKVGS